MNKHNSMTIIKIFDPGKGEEEVIHLSNEVSERVDVSGFAKKLRPYIGKVVSDIMLFGEDIDKVVNVVLNVFDITDDHFYGMKSKYGPIPQARAMLGYYLTEVYRCTYKIAAMILGVTETTINSAKKAHTKYMEDPDYKDKWYEVIEYLRN